MGASQRPLFYFCLYVWHCGGRVLVSEGVSMTLEEFIGPLDSTNPYTEELVSSFTEHMERGRLIVDRKGPDLVEMVERYKNLSLFPIADKKLKLIFGCKDIHHMILGTLFRYHFYATHALEDPIPAQVDIRYVREGHGWYISSSYPTVIMVGVIYIPDRFDKDVFLLHKVARQRL